MFNIKTEGEPTMANPELTQQICTKSLPGRRLRSGERLQAGDMYLCEDGRWREIPVVIGCKVPDCDRVFWVRPDNKKLD